jgi:hypothetical protein
MSITIHGEVNQPVCWRSELAESHAAFGEDARRLIIHEVALIVNNFADAYLGDFDAAGQAWAGVAIKDGCLADAVSTGFEEGVLFGVKAEAGGESDAALGCVVTARAYSKSAFGRFRRGILVYLQPPSLQLVMPLGVPLYPVLTTLFSLTITHPTLLFIQLLLRAARSASCMKY